MQPGRPRLAPALLDYLRTGTPVPRDSVLAWAVVECGHELAEAFAAGGEAAALAVALRHPRGTSLLERVR